MKNAIKKLISRGYTEKEAREEFNELVSYYMRGTLHTTSDKEYAVNCAVDDIMSEEAEEIADDYLDMLDMTYA